jgi:two-component system, OmpR family, alkaline phosphatase synthesis response regulator PhoP
MESILIIEDDPSILRGLRHNLRFEGYSLRSAVDGEVGLELAVNEPPDLILLDVMLPKLNGFEVLRELRRLQLDIPVIMLTAKAEEIDKVRGLDLGADDYVTKPFALPELLARIRSVLRRKRRFDKKTEQATFGDVVVDFAAARVTVRGEPVKLTTRELSLLRLFVEREGDALSREEIVRRVWGYDYEGTERTLDNFVSRLRQKLEPDPTAPRHFLTVRGMGYQFVGAPGEAPA